jgi:hypothetical protein
MGIFLGSQIAVVGGVDPVPDFLFHYKLDGTDASLTRIGGDDFQAGPECNDTTGSFYNGSNQYELATSDSGLVAVGTGPLSISVWVNWPGSMADDAIGNGDGGNNGTFRIRSTSGGGLRFRTAGVNTDTVGTYNDGEWHLLTVTSTGALGVMLIYVDGVLDNTLASQNYNIIDTGTLQVGSSPTNNSHWNGGLDGLRFYDRVLTTDEITALANYTCNGFTFTFPLTLI